MILIWIRFDENITNDIAEEMLKTYKKYLDEEGIKYIFVNSQIVEKVEILDETP